jgi:hypothetical protein
LSLDPSPQGLTVATTARTTRFCRTQRSGFAKRLRRTRPASPKRASQGVGAGRPHARQDLTRFISPWSRLRARRCRVHHPPIHVRYDGRPPLSLDRDGGFDTAIPNFGKAEYFYGGGLTGFYGKRVCCPTGRPWLRVLLSPLSVDSRRNPGTGISQRTASNKNSTIWNSRNGVGKDRQANWGGLLPRMSKPWL